MARSPRNHPLVHRALGYLRVEPGEAAPTLWLSLYLLLGMATVVCLKAVSVSVFLSEFSAENLPYVDLSVTALVALAVSLYLRLAARYQQGPLIGMTLGFLAAGQLLLWLLLRADAPGIAIVLYLWVGTFTVLIPSQVWSLSGTVFNTRQAKRLFALIGSGGILGAALGGNFAGYIGPRIGTEYVLLATVALLAACGEIVRRICRWSPGDSCLPTPQTEKGASVSETFRFIRGERYLLLITVALFLSTIVSTLVKYQFNAIAQMHFGADRDALTSFGGYFLGYIAVFSFLFHTLMTGRLLRWFGLTICLFVLPASLILGTIALLFSSTLAAAVAARGADQAFRHSVDRASVELLYVPLSSAVRTRVKSFLDMVVGRAADGIASIVLVVLLRVVDVELSGISWISLLFLGGWLASLWRLRGQYVFTLRSTIERKDLSAETMLRQLAESPPPERLESTLQGSDQRAIETAVDWMQFSGVGAGRAHLASLLTHPYGPIRRKAMAAVAANAIPGCESETLVFLEIEDDVESRWQALDYLERQDAERFADIARRLLASSDRELAATMAARLMQRSGGDGPGAERIFCEYLRATADAEPRTRAAAARLIGLAPATSASAELLSKFLRDPDRSVVQAALASAAALRPWQEVPRLLEALEDRSVRRAARAALAAFGPEILPVLRKTLASPNTADRIVFQIPRIAAAIGGRAGAEFLLDLARGRRPELTYAAARLLVRLRRLSPQLPFDRERVSELLIDQMRLYYRGAAMIEGIPAESPLEGLRFLRRALRERMDRRLDTAFYLLQLIYPQREIRDAYHWILSGRPDLRSNAIEFLDSRLANPLRQFLLPAVENGTNTALFETARELYPSERIAYPGVVRRLIETGDPWLQACSAYVAGEARLVDYLPQLEPLTNHPLPLLREAARAAVARLTQAAGPSEASVSNR